MEKSGHSWSTVTSVRKVQGQPTERDRILLSIQEMFKGEVDGDVVYMVLQESEWKGVWSGHFLVNKKKLNQKLQMTRPSHW